MMVAQNEIHVHEVAGVECHVNILMMCHPFASGSQAVQ